MELFGIVGSVPAAFVASVVYSWPLRAVPLPPWLRGVFVRVSVLVLGTLVVEWGVLALWGAVAVRAAVGPAFWFCHLAVFLLAVPALANILVLNRGETLLGTWFVVGLLCAVLALPVTLTQYAVSEALYGVDGRGGRYDVP